MKKYKSIITTEFQLPDDFEIPVEDKIYLNRTPYDSNSICRQGCPFCHREKEYDCWGNWDDSYTCLRGCSCIFDGKIEEIL